MKLFIFDMGGVVTQNVTVAPRIAESFGISEDEFYVGCGSTPKSADTSSYNKGDIAALMRGTIGTAQFWENFSTRTGKKVEGDPWDTFFKPEPDSETYRIIDDLKKAGFRVVCGTNSLDAHYHYHVKHGEYDCFDKVYASQIIHIIKPDPEFWLHILKEENIEANDAFFIDDFEENVNAAAKLGLHVHHFKDALCLRKDLADVI
jgi:putative hydrolase of the HAD superfamily